MVSSKTYNDVTSSVFMLSSVRNAVSLFLQNISTGGDLILPLPTLILWHCAIHCQTLWHLFQLVQLLDPNWICQKFKCLFGTCLSEIGYNTLALIFASLHRVIWSSSHSDFPTNTVLYACQVSSSYHSLPKNQPIRTSTKVQWKWIHCGNAR